MASAKHQRNAILLRKEQIISTFFFSYLTLDKSPSTKWIRSPIISIETVPFRFRRIFQTNGKLPKMFHLRWGDYFKHHHLWLPLEVFRSLSPIQQMKSQDTKLCPYKEIKDLIKLVTTTTETFIKLFKLSWGKTKYVGSQCWLHNITLKRHFFCLNPLLNFK